MASTAAAFRILAAVRRSSRSPLACDLASRQQLPSAGFEVINSASNATHNSFFAQKASAELSPLALFYGLNKNLSD